MKVINANNISSQRFERIKQLLPNAENLLQIMNWTKSQPKDSFLSQIVAKVIVQDEFTHDVVIPFQGVFLVFDAT